MRNTIRCNLTGKERITNKSYLRKRLLALGLSPEDPESEEHFRNHYAAESEVAELRRVILSAGLQAARGSWGVTKTAGGPVNRSEAWLLRVALMNGKNKLFKEELAKQELV
jgi:hypothetical protein